MPRTARKPAPKTATLGQLRLDSAMTLYREIPTAENRAKLEAAMACREAEHAAVVAERRERERREYEAHEAEMTRMIAAMRGANIPT